MPAKESFITLRGHEAEVTDGAFTHVFRLRLDGPSPVPHLREAIVEADSGPWKISYEIKGGRIIAFEPCFGLGELAYEEVQDG